MNTLPELASPDDPIMRLAIAAHLARYKGQSRTHTASDLNAFLGWCLEHDLGPLQAQRQHIELYLRWMQEIRRLRPSTVSRRLSVLSGFYRTCVVDGILELSPADYVRRPRAGRVAHPRAEPPAVRGDPHRGARLRQRQRLRPCCDARTPRAADLMRPSGHGPGVALLVAFSSAKHHHVRVFGTGFTSY